MSFDWRDFLELARALEAEAGAGAFPEAAKRSAVSRAYYAAFCWARDYAERQLGFRATKRPRDHSDLRKHFSAQGKQKLASDLDRLRGWRNQCDYESHVDHLELAVEQALSVATAIIDECS
ncbi:MAG: hypothetical protein KatS3mg076_0048 [Candidatus Binatia bacterium]|nr:MAG: hypothetical protein KatS3mg076_0048 [Candidatus Binatia bacterium]